MYGRVKSVLFIYMEIEILFEFDFVSSTFECMQHGRAPSSSCSSRGLLSGCQ